MVISYAAIIVPNLWSYAFWRTMVRGTSCGFGVSYVLRMMLPGFGVIQGVTVPAPPEALDYYTF